MTLLRSFFAFSVRKTMRFGLMLFLGLGLQVSVASKLAGAATILVSDRATNSVLRFDGTSGASRGTLVAPNSGGLFAPTAMTLGFNGEYRCGLFNTYDTPNSSEIDCMASVAAGPLTTIYSAYGWRAARSMHAQGVNVMYMDGSVHVITNSVVLGLWRALSTRAGRENLAILE
jgi:prepilin-type processing-associated H-X9-DG protein